MRPLSVLKGLMQLLRLKGPTCGSPCTAVETPYDSKE